MGLPVSVNFINTYQVVVKEVVLSSYEVITVFAKAGGGEKNVAPNDLKENSN